VVAAGEVNGVDDVSVDGEDSVSSAADGNRYSTIGDATVDETVVTFADADATDIDAVDAVTTDDTDDDTDVLDDVSKAYSSARLAARVHFAGGSKNGSFIGGLGGCPSDMNFQSRFVVSSCDAIRLLNIFARDV
jgi:hypothetical protein